MANEERGNEESANEESGNENGGNDWLKAWQAGQQSFVDAQKGFNDLMLKGKDATPEDWAGYFGRVNGAAMKAYAGAANRAFGGKNTSDNTDDNDTLFDFFDPARWMAGSLEEMQANLEKLAGIPKFADIPNSFAAAADMGAEVAEFQAASSALGSVVYTAWQQAFEEFQKLGLSSHDPKAPDVWMKTANEALLKSQSSEAFLAAQKAMVKASLKLRKRQVDVVQAWAKDMQLPIRSENDELIALVHALKGEVRALREQVDALIAEKNSN